MLVDCGMVMIMKMAAILDFAPQRLERNGDLGEFYVFWLLLLKK